MLLYNNNGFRVYRLHTHRVNTFIIQKDGKNVLWDTSMPFEIRTLFRDFRLLEIDKIDAVFISHAHTDHSANAATIAQKYGCEVFVHKAGMSFLSNGRCPIPQGTNAIGKLVNSLANVFRNVYDFGRIKPCDSVCELTDSAAKALLGEHVELVFTPGHSYDGVSLIIDGKIALVGDIFVNAAWAFYPPFADQPDAILSSWKNLAEHNCAIY